MEIGIASIHSLLIEYEGSDLLCSKEPHSMLVMFISTIHDELVSSMEMNEAFMVEVFKLALSIMIFGMFQYSQRKHRVGSSVSIIRYCSLLVIDKPSQCSLIH